VPRCADTTQEIPGDGKIAKREPVAVTAAWRRGLGRSDG
jgi:hypothetical protein